MRDQVHVCDDGDALAAHACDWLVKQIATHHRQFDTPYSLALSGGSTPKNLYERLSQVPAGEIDWSRVLLVWGDERNVPYSDEQSNYRMVKECLLDHVAIPAENILAVPDPGGSPTKSAKAYEKLLKERLPPRQRLDEEGKVLQANAGKKKAIEAAAAEVSEPAEPVPHIDCVLLGLGDDVHTASLFPGTKAITETERLVVGNEVPQLNTWRITLTAPLINNAANVMFLISGKKKMPALSSLWHAPKDPNQYPSQLIRPVDGGLWFFLDKEAMGDIPLPESVMVQLI